MIALEMPKYSQLKPSKDLQSDLEVKPEWLEVLQLAFEEGLQDKAIGQSMHKSERGNRE